MRGSPSTRITLVQAPVFAPGVPSGALALLYAHLRKAGFEVAIRDASSPVASAICAKLHREFPEVHDLYDAVQAERETVSKVLREEARVIVRGKPDVVGFSVIRMTEELTLELASEVKKLAPGCRIILGGPQCMRAALGFDLIGHPAVDAVALGEADTSLVGLLREFDWDDAQAPCPKGFLLKRGGAVQDGGDGEAVADLDTLPFLDFSGFDMSLYKGDFLSLVTTRSCMHKCVFCSFSLENGYRSMSPDRVAAEIEHQLRLNPGLEFVMFRDSLVNGERRRLAGIAERLIGLRGDRLITSPGLDFGWGGLAALHGWMKPDLLSKLRQSGCWDLSYGLESGSQRVVDLMKKGFKVADAEVIIRDTHRAGIAPKLFIMVGFPGEREEDFLLTLDFIERNARYLGRVGITTTEILRGTYLDSHLEEYDVRLPIGDRVKWMSVDGTNNYEVRRDRVDRLERLLVRRGVDFYQSTRPDQFSVM